MAITLGQLRTFCQERASKDASDTTAERSFMDWINGALGRLYGEVELDTTRREKRITVPPSEEVTDGVVTQNSLALASATGFQAKWLSERWGLHVDAEGQLEFELAAIAAGSPGVTATMRAGDEWIQASATGKTFTFVKNKHLLTAVHTVDKVQTHDGRQIPVLVPADFDQRKQGSPCLRGEVPIVCTFRNSYLEVWPSPGESYQKLVITYRLAWTPLASAGVAEGGDADATVIEWDDDQLDVLKKAIMLEASVEQGTNAPVPYSIALNEYTAAVERMRTGATKDKVAGPLCIRPPITFPHRGRRSLPPRSALEDV